MNKKTKSINEQPIRLKVLEKGPIHTKIVKDKTNYSRKKKHKDSD